MVNYNSYIQYKLLLNLVKHRFISRSLTVCIAYERLVVLRYNLSHGIFPPGSQETAWNTKYTYNNEDPDPVQLINEEEEEEALNEKVIR